MTTQSPKVQSVVDSKIVSPCSKELHDLICEITFEHELIHLGSCLTAAPIIEEIYGAKSESDIFILSAGHAGVALYCFVQLKYGISANAVLEKHGLHPNKDFANHLMCSAGSLGCGLPIAVGHALADRKRQVHVLLSDGECAEGSIWESLAFITNCKIDNIHVYVNINGWGAYDSINVPYLVDRLKVFLPRIHIRLTGDIQIPGTSGLESHYYRLKVKDMEEIRKEASKRHKTD